jgi:hypothetical protein
LIKLLIVTLFKMTQASLVSQEGTASNLLPTPSTETMDIDSLTEAQLDEQIAAAQQKETLRKKRKQLADLRSRENEPSDSEDPVPQKKAKNDVFSKAALPPLKYRGKSRTEMSSFLINLRSRFFLAGDELKDDTTRVIYASTCLEDPAKRRWMRHLTATYQGEPANVTWSAFEHWIRTSVADETTSSLTSTLTLTRLEQGDAESFADFLERYEKAEAEDPDDVPDRQRAMRLFAKLNATLLTKVSQGVIPETREALVAAAQRAELIAKEVGKSKTEAANRSRERPPPSSGVPDAKDPDKSNLSYSRPPWKDRPILCYNCNKPGHLSPQCSEPLRCHKCHQPGHMGRYCPTYAATSVNAMPQGPRYQRSATAQQNPSQ